MAYHRYKKFIIPSVSLLVLLGVGYGGYRYYLLSQQNKQLLSTVADLLDKSGKLRESLFVTQTQNEALSSTLDQTQSQVADLTNTTEDLSQTVNNYEKLSSLDPELLKKYSKVYFLNENYVPSSLSDIDPKYVSGKGRTLQLHTEVMPFFTAMIDDANNAGLGLLATSAYRSFKTQGSLKSQYTVVYGAGTANSFSADQGYSEHQLGTAVDFTTAKTGVLQGFDKTPEYTWLTDNAYKYGFILSYPKGNKYYIYEPWHWRFVGIALATALHDNGGYLYDMDQRIIDQYLITIFD
ncbi:MAG TPA: M15 family metallopeptidase [Candidatus Paceibacterota bacterium]|nr:M15 family metallopeptidase [Candidatus Paceibacterota bacterium]